MQLIWALLPLALFGLGAAVITAVLIRLMLVKSLPFVAIFRASIEGVAIGYGGIVALYFFFAPAHDPGTEGTPSDVPSLAIIAMIVLSVWIISTRIKAAQKKKTLTD